MPRAPPPDFAAHAAKLDVNDHLRLASTFNGLALIMKELTDTAKAANHKGFEKPRETFVEAQPFDADRGLLTPTFKPKRPQLRKHYQDKLDAMYAALNSK